MKKLITKGNWPAWAMLLGFLMLLLVLNGYLLPVSIFWLLEIPLVICAISFGSATIALLVRLYRFLISKVKSAKTKNGRVAGLVGLILGSIAVLPFIGMYWFGTLISGLVVMTNAIFDHMAQHEKGTHEESNHQTQLAGLVNCRRLV